MNQPAEEQETNFEYVERVKRQFDLTYRKMAKLSGYSEESVRAWFANHNSSKFRTVPDRAVKILKLELNGRKPLYD